MYLKSIEIQSILNGSYLYIFVIFIVLLSILIIALTKNVYKIFRNLGIVTCIVGVITVIVSEAIQMVLSIFSSEIREYIAIINSVLKIFIEKLTFISYLEIGLGIILIIFSIILKKTRNDFETE